MIRFSCPHCARDYVLANALARLPLLCKGCGQQLTVPEPSPEPEPPPLEFFAPPQPVKPPPSPSPPARPVPEGDDEPLFEAETPDIDFNSPPPKELRRPLSPPPPEPPPAPPPKPPGSRKAVGLVVDLMVVLLLIAGGAFLGEMLAQKGTREVLDGVNGPKFPQVALLMWLAPPVLLVLVYALLGSRGKTVGAWLNRRAG